MAKAARYLLYALILWAPLPLGSNRPVFWVVNAIVASAILVLFLAGELRAHHDSHFAWRPVVWVALIMAAWAGWMVVQAVPFTPPNLHHPIWAQLAADLPGARGAISINPSTTWATIAEFVPIVFLGLVAIRLSNDARRTRLLLNVIVLATVVVALYGLAAFALGLDRVVWLDDASFEGYLTGTFIGRSAAATYFVIGIAAATALMAARVESAVARQGTDISWTVQVPTALGAAFPYLVATAILIVAILFTGSRGGIIATVLALLSVAWLSMRRSRLGRRAMLAVFGGAIVIFAGVALLSSSVLLDRLAAGGILDENRRQIYRDTIEMIESRPILGQGAGTFVDAFPLFNDNADIGRVWLRAHSSYLQGAAELGLPVFALVMLGIIGVLVATWRGSFHRGVQTPAAVAALGAAVATGVQSAVDFSVQIQAISLTLVVLLGAGFGEAIAGRSKPPAPDRDEKDEGRMAPSLSSVRTTETVKVRVPVRTRAPAGDIGSLASTTEGLRIYVFADVHGRYDLLEDLRTAIRRDRSEKPGPEVRIVGLGDYVDRGPRSRSVIEALSGEDWFGSPATYLRGNHEHMMLQFVDDPARYGPLWFRNGGAETFRSYVEEGASMLARPPVDYAAIRERLVADMPQRHLEWLRQLPRRFEDGGYFFAHAGARPGVPLPLQRDEDLLWIREGFSDRDAPFEKVIVHGHTPVDQPYFGRYRINLDTGAYFTNRLSCLVLEGPARRLLSFEQHSPQPAQGAN